MMPMQLSEDTGQSSTEAIAKSLLLPTGSALLRTLLRTPLPARTKQIKKRRRMRHVDRTHDEAAGVLICEDVGPARGALEDNNNSTKQICALRVGSYSW